MCNAPVFTLLFCFPVLGRTVGVFTLFLPLPLWSVIGVQMNMPLMKSVRMMKRYKEKHWHASGLVLFVTSLKQTAKACSCVFLISCVYLFLGQKHFFAIHIYLCFMKITLAIIWSYRGHLLVVYGLRAWMWTWYLSHAMWESYPRFDFLQGDQIEIN